MNKYAQKEIEILRRAVDKAENKRQTSIVNSPEIKQIIKIVEEFLKNTKCVCYGGTAINNILPVDDQFYNMSVEIPDYDFYSNTALTHAKQLADIYFKKGFTEVEAKAGMHHGTFKVFVNFIPVADISQLTKETFVKIKKNAITRQGILYAPPNFLRMAMYLELSRPDGDVSRWEKVLKRLILLNKNYPLKGTNCNKALIQRKYTGINTKANPLYNILLQAIVKLELVFFGGYANMLYSRYMPNHLKKKLKKIPDFDVLANDPYKTTIKLINILKQNNYKKVSYTKHNGVGEIIAPHYEITIGDETIIFIYKPLACHSYNIIKINKVAYKIATIDTMLSFYLAFLYADRPYYDDNRILCMAQNLFIVQQKNRLEQKGLLRRFSLSCYGTQSTKESMRAEKSEMFKKLANKRNSTTYESWFLKYNPQTKKNQKTKNTKQKTKTAKTKRKL